MDIVHESRADGTDPKPESDGRDEPPWADDFADHVGRDLEQNVRDIEHGEDPVVIVAAQLQIFLEPSDFRVSCRRCEAMATLLWRRNTYQCLHDR